MRKGARPWLLTAANVLNELPSSRKSRFSEDGDDEDGEPSSAGAGTLEGVLSSLTTFLDGCEESRGARMLFIEPGTRLGGLTLMNLRAIAREEGLKVIAPCPHVFGCPLARPDEDEAVFASGPGLTSRLAGRTWCHYTFDALGAPAWLEKLSIEAGLQKASLSLAVLELGPGIGAMQGLMPTPGNLALAAFLIGWGGVSVHCQTAAVIAGTDIKSARHTVGRLLHGAISALCMWVLANLL